MIGYDKTDENNTLEENRAKYFEETNFKFKSPGNQRKNGVI